MLQFFWALRQSDISFNILNLICIVYKFIHGYKPSWRLFFFFIYLDIQHKKENFKKKPWVMSSPAWVQALVFKLISTKAKLEA